MKIPILILFRFCLLCRLKHHLFYVLSLLQLEVAVIIQGLVDSFSSFWLVLVPFRSFYIVLGRFSSWFQLVLEGFSSFQVVPHLSKYRYQRWYMKKSVRRNFTKFTENFIKKETLAHVFSCEFCEISKNTFFTENLQTTASGETLKSCLLRSEIY